MTEVVNIYSGDYGTVAATLHRAAELRKRGEVVNIIWWHRHR